MFELSPSGRYSPELGLASAETRCGFTSFDSIEQREYEQRCPSELTKEPRRLLTSCKRSKVSNHLWKVACKNSQRILTHSSAEAKSYRVWGCHVTLSHASNDPVPVTGGLTRRAGIDAWILSPVLLL